MHQDPLDTTTAPGVLPYATHKGPIHSLSDLPWSVMTSSLSHVVLGMLIIFANAKIADFLLQRFGDAGAAAILESKVVESN